MVHEMKSFRKPMALVLSFLVAFTCSAALFRTSSRAATYGDLEHDGWEIDESGKLTVITQEAMENRRWLESGGIINPETGRYDSLYWATYSVEIGGDVTVVCENAFKGFERVETVTFSGTNVTTIKDSAFENCTGLESITLPSSLTKICNSAFANSGLKSVTIPSNVDEVESNIFYDCRSLTSVTIASRYTSFMSQAGATLETLNFVGSKSQHAYQFNSFSGLIGEGTTVNYGAFDVEFNYNYDGCPVSSWQTVSKNETVSKPNDPVRDGYRFAGWFCEDSCTNRYDFTTAVTSDVALYAKWVEASNSVLDGYKLSLDGDVGINFYISLSDEIKADSQAKLVFSRTVGNQVIEEERLVSENVGQDTGKNCLIYKINISPAEMTCPIVITLVDGQQNEIDLGTFEARSYAEYIIEHELFKTANVAISMLNYGTYCQKRFGINVNDLANKNIAADWDNVSSTTISGVTPVSVTGDLTTVEYYGSNLDLRTNTDAYLYFSYEGSFDGITATVDGNAVDVVQNQTKGYFNIRIPGIRANLLSHPYSVVITKGGETLTVTYSPLVYCDGVANGTAASEESLVNLVKALYLYSSAADNAN